MSKEMTGILLALVGGVGVVVALVKFSVIGFYPDEVPLFGGIGAVGFALAWLGSRIYQSAKLGG